MPHDPAPAGRPYYECMDCGHREQTEPETRLCTICGGYLQNISVPRQQ